MTKEQADQFRKTIEADDQFVVEDVEQRLNGEWYVTVACGHITQEVTDPSQWAKLRPMIIAENKLPF